MAYEYITYEKKGRLAYVTINRPERLNALHPPASAELREVFEDFRDDPEVWIAILTGKGDRAFSAGNDLRYTAEQDQDRDRPERAAARVPFGGITAEFDCWKPLIAAVNGYALGGGFELALACDIVIAADHAEVGLPEPRVGLYAGAGGVHRLPRHIPLKIAMGMMLTATRIKAEDAHRLGLVNEVVPLADLMPAAERWASEILECAPLSVRASKQMALQGLDSPLDIAFARSYSQQRLQVASADRVEGPRAFSEKRKPNWTAK
ncbi:MAG: enoyl-CoA hydratase [SAR202 cluster bacterium]|jgi:enoyl-CoA hydratase/carnithine racemase|nr:enoyl-CoA hydratase [Chloroflexota bacterium]MDP6420060.1 enoyl-CoA hydratase-related protein [SAR202 cluster bacterium]HAL46894.1 enoyl-CoA hydratase [Dehalococcoidia bacterium]MDP6664417.1 enoyl-CoA hydratase-related protein [SAR202 cluster bacterium]MDP6799985.1 enoyl-CoA hydratase-related protein [SAR202 cluster bacterium]|tara:strand:- start:2064 stop:2855 length:792 start_codon:yes stop_codon:yes gene_type:complete